MLLRLSVARRASYILSGTKTRGGARGLCDWMREAERDAARAAQRAGGTQSRDDLFANKLKAEMAEESISNTKRQEPVLLGTRLCCGSFVRYLARFSAGHL